VKLYTREGEEKWILILLNGEEYQGNSYAGRMTVYGPGILENYGQQVIFLILPADGKDLLYQRAEYLGNRYCYDFENDMHNLRKWKAHLDHIKWEKIHKAHWNTVMSEVVLSHYLQ
jgi:hypothetical protein